MTKAGYTDERGQSLPVMRPANGSSYVTSITSSSTKQPNKITEDVVTLYATVDCYIKTGNLSVTVSASSYDRFLPASTMVSIEMEEVDYIAVIRASSDGTLYINGET